MASATPLVQDAKEWSTPLKSTTRPSVDNMKTRIQHRLAAKDLLRRVHKRNIGELTKVERVAAQEEEPQLSTIEPSLGSNWISSSRRWFNENSICLVL